MPAIAPFLKRYAFPLFLLALSIFFQVVINPSAFPPSHYDVLGVKRFASIEEVSEAYEKLSSRWNSGLEVPNTIDFIKIHYAFEFLTNPLWKRDYDIFGIDENLHVLEKLKEQFKGESFSKVNLPLLNGSSSVDSTNHAFNALTAEDFMSTIGNSTTWLIQVYSSGSTRCMEFSNSWKRIASLLDGVAGTGRVELGEVQLAAYLAERRRSTGKPFFRNGLPSLIVFPSGCRSLDCLIRYQGELSVDAVVDWTATKIFGLPRIIYYSKETLGPNFISKSGPHKVKVICFSKTGERAAPLLRQAAKDYWPYASFASVLWREEEASIWWNMLEVDSAPAVVFLKDPGVKPVVYHGAFNSSKLSDIMEEHKHQELPQLRSVTSMELGCDARGYSRAGNDTVTWYCVILAGRLSLELNKMRETVRRVQNVLLNDDGFDTAVKDTAAAPSDTVSVPSLAADTLKRKRLTFAWLDGEAQKQYCFFYLHSEDVYETCGPRRDISDSPRLFIVRYKRNSTNDNTKVEKKPKSIWDSYLEEDDNLASQLVARYNGSADIAEIIKWVSQIIKDGDSRDLPFFTAKTPQLIPEDASPILSKGAQGILSTSNGLKHRIWMIVADMFDRLKDPWIGPALLLGACISFGSIWMQSQSSISATSPAQDWQPSISEVEQNRDQRSSRAELKQKRDLPSSVTDAEPDDAYQLLSSGSGSD